MAVNHRRDARIRWLHRVRSVRAHRIPPRTYRPAHLFMDRRKSNGHKGRFGAGDPACPHTKRAQDRPSPSRCALLFSQISTFIKPDTDRTDRRRPHVIISDEVAPRDKFRRANKIQLFYHPNKITCLRTYLIVCLYLDTFQHMIVNSLEKNIKKLDGSVTEIYLTNRPV